MKKIILLSMVLFISNSVQAGVRANVKLAYNFENYEFKAKPGVLFPDAKGTLNGPGLGVRLDYTMGLPFLGVEADYMTLTMVPDGGSTSYNSTRTTVYGILGVDFVGGLQLFAGYSLSDSRTTKGTTEDTVTGSTMKAGVNFRFMPMLRVGVEYLMHTADKLQVGTTSYTVGDMYTSTTNSSVLATVTASF